MLNDQPKLWVCNPARLGCDRPPLKMWPTRTEMQPWALGTRNNHGHTKMETKRHLQPPRSNLEPISNTQYLSHPAVLFTLFLPVLVALTHPKDRTHFNQSSLWYGWTTSSKHPNQIPKNMDALNQSKSWKRSCLPSSTSIFHHVSWIFMAG